MLKQNLIFALILLSGCSYSNVKKESNEEQITKEQVVLDITNFSDLKDHDKAIIKFHADWCGPCKMSAQPFAEMADQFSDIKFFTVNVDKDGDLKDKFDIKSLPTFIILEDGKQKELIIGFNKTRISEALNNLGVKKDEGIITKIRNKKEFEKALKENKKVIVKFYGDWCGFCKMIAPDYEKLSKEYGDKVRFLEVEISENEDLAQEHNIRGVPMFKSFDNGSEKEVVTGADKEGLSNSLKKLAE